MGLMRRLFGFGLVLWTVCFAAVEWRLAFWSEVDQERLDPKEIATTLEKWAEELENIPKLKKEDTVEVYYAEHLLASWVLEASPWNAFHSGMVFQVKDKGSDIVREEYAIDFTPVFTETVSYVLHPLIDPVYPSWMPHWLGVLYSRATTSYNLTWQNQGGARYHVGVPRKFTNFTHVGTTDGEVFNKLVDWVAEYDRTHKTFEPVEIVLHGEKEGGQGSSMCHDLFYHALEAMVGFGFKPKPKDYIFRDHIMVFAESYQVVDDSDPEVKKDIIRYYRMFISFMELINVEFTNIRGLLVSAKSVSVRPYLYSQGKYYQVQLAAPFVNYCYLEVAMPPKKTSVWDSEHLCALEQDVTKLENHTGWSQVQMMLQPRNFFYFLEGLVDDIRVPIALFTLFLGTFVF